MIHFRAGNDDEELEADPRLSVETTECFSARLLSGDIVVHVERVQLHRIMSTDEAGPWLIGVLFMDLKKEHFQDPRDLLMTTSYLYVHDCSGRVAIAKMAAEDREASFFVRVEFHLFPH